MQEEPRGAVRGSELHPEGLLGAGTQVAHMRER